MIHGTIRARHILSHPIMLIGAFGIVGYLRLLARCLDSSRHGFTDFLLR